MSTLCHGLFWPAYASSYPIEVTERANKTHEHILRGVCLNYVTLFNAKPAQSHARKANRTSLDFSGLPGNIQECPGISMNIQEYPGISMNVQEYPCISDNIQEY